MQKKGRLVQEQIEGVLHSALHYHKAHSDTFIYGFWTEGEGMIGVTPELLLKVKEGVARTEPCAGTAPLSNAKAMLHDPKLRKEHQMVIDGLQTLACFGSVKVGTTQVKTYSKLAHLITPIEIHGVTANFENIISLIHPTAALGTSPKEEGMKNYPLERGRFGAPFGVLQSQEEVCIYVAIRNIQWNTNEAVLMAGSGIIQESILSEEKKEILDKFKAIHEIIGLS